MSNPIQCTANLYGCNAPLDVPAIISTHPDTDGNGLYLSIRSPADNAPHAGIDLTIDQAERLVESLKWALVLAHSRRIASELKAREVQP